jgi:SAM-dependent methyltransferase
MIDTWEAWSAQIADDPRHEWARDLASRLPDGARVLELGCGGGTRETRDLAARFSLTGVDLSERQLERARTRVPAATFVRGDLTEIDFGTGSFDAVVAFYFERVHSWLAEYGLFMATLGAADLEAWTGDFLGAPTFFSGYEPATNSRLVRDAGFELVRDEVVEIAEPEGTVRFHWVLARR